MTENGQRMKKDEDDDEEIPERRSVKTRTIKEQGQTTRNSNTGEEKIPPSWCKTEDKRREKIKKKMTLGEL